ncbi:MAG: TIGR00269 family protein [Candidatus ainarchaeum sp.]|nr:TIGR00269 family protein [Candidatus ainarchaeum sp.]
MTKNKIIVEKKSTKLNSKFVCDKCNKKKVITLNYGPHNFCKKHFNIFFENRFKKTIRKYSLFKSKEKLLIAVSGGKDSIVTLTLLNKFYSKSNPIEVLIIDEGVKNYRNKAIKIAKKTCKKLGVKYHIISFKKRFGITNDEIMPILLENKKLGGTCAFCGVMRRNIMNNFARKMKADKLVTGHNLNDEVQSFVMNVFNNEIERIIRSGAKPGIIKHNNFVKRIKPLYETPEKEIIAYCAFNNIEHYSQECCPYSWTAKRNEYREMLNKFENRFPGNDYSILRFYETLKKKITPTKNEKEILQKQLKECSICGEPTEKKICKTCELIQKMKNEKKIKKKNKITKNTKKFIKKNKLTCAITKYNK